MKSIICTLFLFFTGVLFSQQKLVFDSLETIARSSRKVFTPTTLHVHDKIYKIDQIQIDNIRFSLLRTLETEEEETNLNYMKAFFMKVDSTNLLFRGTLFPWSGKSAKDIYQIIILDSNYQIDFALYFSNGVLVGISKFEYNGKKVVENYCLIVCHPDIPVINLESMDIFNLTDVNWVDEIFKKQSSKDINLLYVKRHKINDLYKIFLQNSPESW